MRNLIAVIPVVVFTVAASTAEAQFAPEVVQHPDSTVTVTVDPNNPSSVTITRIDKPAEAYRRVDHYYYDCLKKKWVWVSRDWYGGPGFADLNTPIPTPKGGSASPDVKQLPSGPPPGAETSASDPDRAFDPKTGQNFAREPDGSWIDTKTGKAVAAPKLCPPCPETPSTTPQPPPAKTPEHAQNTTCPDKRRTAMLQPLPPFDQRILDLHNAERAAVGAPPLQWNPALAEHAAGYAQQLAQAGQLAHAPREGRGIERENLQQGLIGWGADRLMEDWTSEKRFFHPGIYPNVCSSGDWLQCSHYSQIIWPTTTDLGCGMVQGGGFEWFVCRYSPGGNKDGKPVGTPVQIAEGPCVESGSLPPTERGL